MEYQQILDLLDRMETSSLTELSIKTPDGFKLSLKKNGVTTATPIVPQESVTVSKPVSEVKADDEESSVDFITSPMVGTFYAAPSVDSYPFVEEMGRVKPGDPVCIIEAMKMNHFVEADGHYQVLSVLVDNGQMVEYGTPLFKVKRHAEVPAHS